MGNVTEDPRRILVIRPSALGDVCRSVPVLVSLKRRWPGAEIDWLVRTSFLDAVRCHPDLARAIPFPRRRLGIRRIWTPEGRRALEDLLRALHPERARRYDLVVDCQGLTRSGLFSWLTQARRRVGFANAREFGWLGYTERHRVPIEMHTVDRMLALVEAAGVPAVRDMCLYAPMEEREGIDERLRGRRFAVVAPTSRWEGKRWPDDRFARVIEAMLGADGGVEAVAVVASETERDQCRAVLELCARDDRVVDLVGRTSVGGLMAVIEASRFVLANDSAALHMAVGFDKPLVALFGPTRIDRVGPYGREGDVVQAEAPGAGVTHKNAVAGRALMARISTERVIEAVMERVGGATSVGRLPKEAGGVTRGEA